MENAEGVRLVRGRGCPRCYDSGYKGRMPVHELLTCNGDTQALMIADPTREALAAHLRTRGIPTLTDAGMAAAMGGHTSVEEVARVIGG